jgi:hypothetical protein
MAVLALAAMTMAGCAAPNLDDARVQTLLDLPGPQHYAERNIAMDLTSRCAGYGFDSDLADAMSEARRAAGAAPGSTRRGDVDLETDVKKRSLAAYYGASGYDALDACDTLDREVMRQTPLSALVVKGS